jgi:hemerythrin-like metal-binding protein
LDRSLIRTIDSDEREQMIVRSLITIFHGLFLDVVAEGVETIEQVEILKTYGCDYIQGYWFSHPLPEREFIDYCLTHRMSDEIATLPKLMLRMEWRKEWECGNETIDSQHRELIRITNELLTHVSEGKAVGKDTINLLDRLLSDCGEHFGDEEKALSAIGYPDRINHGDIHESILAKTLKMREAYRTGEVKFSTFVLFIVDDVILGHLLNEDEKFFSYIRKTRCDA